MSSVVKTLRLLADETRLRILLLLRQEELSVVELQEILGMGQSRISTHLAQLRQAGIVQDRRAGKNSYYTFNQEGAAMELSRILDATSRELPLAASDSRALSLAIAKRHDKTREYFNQLAGKFGRTYCPGRTWQGLAHLLLALVPEIAIADLGAGEGTLSQLLARRARKVIAVDSSEKMVEFGRQLALAHGLANLDYRLGDIEAPPIDDASVDLAILSQALHHARSPLRAAQAAHRILKPRGRIAVLDLLAHQFEQARELYADTWLGFTEAQLFDLLTQAGFHSIEVGVVARDEQNPQFQTLLATGVRK
jgi:ubiquinone/menaquinone biosynthesis C-methylase UbiE/biotin operon repressor